MHFVFGTDHGPDSLDDDVNVRKDCPFDASEAQLSTLMQAAWAAFARDGTPGWPGVSAGALPVMRLRSATDGGAEVDTRYKGEDCTFWDGLRRSRESSRRRARL